MPATQERKAFAYSRDHEFTKEEYDALASELTAAIKRKDDDTFMRLIKKAPMDADVLKAFASVYGRGFVLRMGFDLTQANMKYGKGWLNELKP